MQHTLHQLFGIPTNIIQAPMAGVQNWELAVAVSKAGGLGSIPCGMLTPEQVAAEIEQFKAHSNYLYNLNFFCHHMPPVNKSRLANWQEKLQHHYDELGLKAPSEITGLRYPFDEDVADTIESFQPPIISFHFGLPAPKLVERIKSWGTIILASATTVEEAVWLQNHGADMIIAQGVEAGGHRGMFLSNDLATQLPTLELVTAIREQVSLPIIAAGGIGSKKDVERLISQGCSGVQVGTAFLLCDEAKTTSVHRAAIKSSNTKSAITNIFSGRPARGIVNKVMLEFGCISDDAPEFPYASIALAPLRAKAESLNSSDFTPLWAGTNTEGCQETTASQLIETLAVATNTVE
ncbi:nitronate monooxygenase [Vibrio sp. SCSIO 43136]|uniref:NAD(P)H-dependent flavin oxidoreductase n=1 Tax=Vibrio sp. SCSIO 43136 TaxID=2819101 RepID=UPI00207630D7|nr:nitronate monooxygenase [Vibrio sp. SCSIO 43136]USD68027.1 nitronate monooxygenase [Vibrio sp. SCSIO 43136]